VPPPFFSPYLTCTVTKHLLVCLCACVCVCVCVCAQITVMCLYMDTCIHGYTDTTGLQGWAPRFSGSQEPPVRVPGVCVCVCVCVRPHSRYLSLSYTTRTHHVSHTRHAQTGYTHTYTHTHSLLIVLYFIYAELSNFCPLLYRCSRRSIENWHGCRRTDASCLTTIPMRSEARTRPA
jgi:hypothetical protein